MKTNLLMRFIVLSFLLCFPTSVISDGGLARGAVPGELYIYGAGGTFPDWVDWLYRCSDYGQTVYLQNDTVLVTVLAEGVAEGELYKIKENLLSYSDNFGVDFVLKGPVGPDFSAIAAGYAPGEVYVCLGDLVKYSSDYGKTFDEKGTCPWPPVRCMSVGHNPGEIYCGCNRGKICYSTNYGETYELASDLGPSIDVLKISSGSASDEIYFFGSNGELYYSPNQGDSLYHQHHFDISYVTGIAGGYIQGEVYVLESIHYFEGGGDLYIHRSTDCGQTFTTYHVYSAQEDVLPPETVTDLVAMLADTSIMLTWSAIDKDIWGNPEEIDYYGVYRNTDPNFIPTTEDSIAAPAEPTYIDSESDSLISFFYVVTAVDTSGNMSVASNKVGKSNKVLVAE